MREFLRFLYVGFLEGDDWVIRSLLLMVNGLVWFLTAWLLISVTDYTFKVDHQETMTIRDKVYHEAYYYNTMVGKVSTINYMPESFEIILTSGDEVVSCTVGETFYNKSKIGEYKEVSYYKGLTNTTYCVNVGELL